jgi:hypothetical protein
VNIVPQKINNIKGQWNIDFEHNKKVETNTFDYLTICTGTNQKSKEIPLKNKHGPRCLIDGLEELKS